MEYVLIWLGLAVLVGLFASDTTLGFWSGFLFSVILSPVVGFIIYLFYPSKEKAKMQEQILLNQQKLLNQQVNITKPQRTLTDELTKLENLKTKKLISDDEYSKLREKLMKEFL